jgi:hypothetical protein
MTTDGKRRMMAVDFEPGPPARIAQPRVLFEFDPHELAGFSCIPVRCYGARDRQRFTQCRWRPHRVTPR